MSAELQLLGLLRRNVPKTLLQIKPIRICVTPRCASSLTPIAEFPTVSEANLENLTTSPKKLVPLGVKTNYAVLVFLAEPIVPSPWPDYSQSNP